MTGTIRGVLFDKDGTLVDFERTWPPAYRAVAAELEAAAGTPGLGARLLRLGGYDESGALAPGSPLASGTNEALAALWAGVPELAGVADIAGRIDRTFLDHARRAPATVPDLGALLDRLAARGLVLGIATNDAADAVSAWLATAGLGARFAFVAGGDSGHGAKPEPGVVHAFCGATGLAPAAVAMVGDSPHDMACGRAAGCGLVVGVLTGVGGREALAADADAVIASIAELERLLG